VPNLSDTNLKAARLDRADLTGENLRKANLEKTRMSRAILRGAQLQEASFKGAIFNKADLSGADLSDADNLTQAQLDEACGNADTVLPGGMTIPACE